MTRIVNLLVSVTYILNWACNQLCSHLQSHMASQSNQVHGMCTLSVIIKSTLYKRRTAHSNTAVNWTDALDLPQVTRGSEVCCHHQCKRWNVNKLINYINKFKNSGIIYNVIACLSIHKRLTYFLHHPVAYSSIMSHFHDAHTQSRW